MNKWPQRKLRTLIEVKHGYAFKSDFFSDSGKYVLLTPGNFWEKGGFRWLGEKQKYFLGDVLNGYVLKKGDLLVAMTEQAPGLLGSAAFILEDDKFLHNQRLGLLQIKNTCVSKDFLYHVFNSQIIRKPISRMSTGTKVKHSSPEKIGNIYVPVPPIEQQTAIAETLFTWDLAIEKTERLIAMKEQRFSWWLDKLINQGSVKGEWRRVKLGEVGEISSAGVDKKSRPEEISVRLVNYLDVYRRDLIYSHELTHMVTAPPAQTKRCSVRKGDIFFTPSSEVRDDIGHSSVAMEDIPDAVYSYHVVRFRVHEDWDLLYRAYAFKSRDFYRQAQTLCDGSGQRYVISQENFRRMEVSVPPLERQKQIANTLNTSRQEIDLLKRQAEAYRKQKRGLMQKLLTGRWGVKVTQAVIL